jgi:hypothetical protein
MSGYIPEALYSTTVPTPVFDACVGDVAEGPFVDFGIVIFSSLARDSAQQVAIDGIGSWHDRLPEFVPGKDLDAFINWALKHTRVVASSRAERRPPAARAAAAAAAAARAGAVREVDPAAGQAALEAGTPKGGPFSTVHSIHEQAQGTCSVPALARVARCVRRGPRSRAGRVPAGPGGGPRHTKAARAGRASSREAPPCDPGPLRPACCRGPRLNATPRQRDDRRHGDG